MIRKTFNLNRKIGAVQTAFGIFIGTGIWLTSMVAESTISTNSGGDYEGAPEISSPPITSPAKQAQIESTLNGLPLLFVENRGQFPDPVAYTMQGRAKNFFFTPDGVTISLTKPAEAEKTSSDAGLMKASLSSAPQRWAMKLDFVNANSDVQPQGEDLQPAVISYFKGPQLSWKTGLRTYTTLRYSDLWPGIDLVYTGSTNQLKYQFEVQPGADPKLIQLAYQGVTGITLTESGALTVTTPAGHLNDERPVAYQMKDGQQVEVTADYALGDVESDKHPYNFTLGSYDPTRPLVIDPSMLVYAGYIGGNRGDWGTDIAVDAEGHAYVTGHTGSSEASFPVTVGPDLTQDNIRTRDAFVAKVAVDGSHLIYAGYIGGIGEEYSWGIAVDGSGNAYIAGQVAKDSDFPVTVGPDLTYNGHNSDAFVAKVSADGTHLEYAGYIGGSSADRAFDIAVDPWDRAYVTGHTYSNNFPAIVGPDLDVNNGTDAFVARVAVDGSHLEYSGYIGGSSLDYATGIAVDSQGRAYVTGYTTSTESSNVPFPVTVGPDTTHNGGNDAFVTRVSADGTWLEYAGYIGGTGSDVGRDIAVDSLDNAYVVGETSSTEASFPVIVGPDLTHNGGKVDTYVAKISMDGARLDYAGYIGGNGVDYGNGIAVDKIGNAYVTGYTNSNQTTFPVLLGPDLTVNYSSDAFVARVSADGAGLDYAGYIGGRYWDIGYGIDVDVMGNAYVTGYTYSNQATFPVTVGPDLTHNGGKIDAFVAKIANPFPEEVFGQCKTE